MSLSNLIRNHSDTLVHEWAAYAEEHITVAGTLSQEELEDSARSMFMAFAQDMDTAQTPQEQYRKSLGTDSNKAHCPIVEHASAHADHRLSQGFSLNDLAAEFRAARASVMRLWMEDSITRDVEDIVRFNEAVDEAVHISLKRFDAQLNRSRDLFLGVLGHDMRNPLGAIMMSSRMLLKDDSLSPASAKAATRLYASGSRLKSMLNDLLDFTRTRLGKSLPVTLVEGDMGETVGSVVDELRAYHPTTNIQFEASGDLYGRWDFGRMAQVVSNLGGNAIQYGSKAAPIVIRLDGFQDKVVLTVTNAGIPIPPEILNRIFDPLTRGTESSVKGSIGLGLYISKQIALGHQGGIEVTSDEVETTFKVWIARHVERRKT